MAILRDKVTSAPLYEGTPLEAALLARSIGFDEVLFDDVGLEFNPNAVLSAYDENLAASQAVAKSTKKADAASKAYAQEEIARLQESQSTADTAQPDVEAQLAEARERVGT